MKVEFIHIHRWLLADEGKRAFRAKAKIDVPGLGAVEIDHALSDELIERIEAEAIAALRLKLGQKIEGGEQ